MSLILQAATLGRKAHEGQKRKYTGVPYFRHCERVAGRVGSHPQATEEMVATAYVHDVEEDTDFKVDELGPKVKALTVELTNPSKNSPSTCGSQANG